MFSEISVLIADDNVEITTELGEFLRTKSDIRLTTVANDGAAAYELIMETEPDVVILDMVMP